MDFIKPAPNPNHVLEDSEESDDSGDDEDNNDNDRLFAGSPLSVSEFMLMMLTFMRHKLTGTCLGDLLALIGKNTVFWKSIYKKEEKI